MKKFAFLLLVLISFSTYAQIEKEIVGKAMTDEDKKKLTDTLEGWKIGETGGINFNQAGFVNWAAGGTPAVSLLFNGRVYADYKRGKHLMQNWFAAEYGIQFLKNDDKNWELSKSADRWELFSKYGYQISKKWYASTYVDLRSQFAPTKVPSVVDANQDSVVSKMGSPMTLEWAVGFDYVPNQYFSLFLSPLATKFVFVADDAIAMTNTYGNIYPEKVKKELGAVLIATYNQTFIDRINLSSIFKAYKDYLNPKPGKNIDIDWQTTIGLKVTSWLSANIFTQLVWDYDTKFTEDDGTITEKVQFRDVIGVNLGYTANWYKAKDQKAIKF
ncbi:MAG: DUF3078 domain-containing protein [Chitinophagales bacterium]|nr:DUF3078 domain-containing protein [Chitinophagales bacterium]